METDLLLQISQHQASLKHENFTLSYHSYTQGRSQDFSKGGAEVMEANALKKKNCLWLE